MKILHVIWSVDPRTGGPGCVVRNIVREQAKRGHRVALVATGIQVFEPRVASHVFAQDMAADPDFADVDLALRSFWGKRGVLASFAYSPECRRLLSDRIADSRTRPDIVHIHGVFAHVQHAAAALARRNKIPYVWEPFGSLDPACLEMGSRWLKRLFIRGVVARDLRHAAFVHPASPHERDSLLRWVPEDRLRTITHGVSIPEYDVASVTQQFLNKFPQLRDSHVILFLSRYTPKKRPELIVEAMARLRDKFPNLYLLMAGNDEGQLTVVRATARRLGLEGSVVDAGFLQGEMKQGAFAVADLYALPSIDENFGIAPVEAMAHGVPALVTPGVGSHVHIDNSGGGLTVDDSVDGLAAGMQELLANNPKEIGRRGKHYVAQHLAWGNVAYQLDALYDECRR